MTPYNRNARATRWVLFALLSITLAAAGCGGTGSEDMGAGGDDMGGPGEDQGTPDEGPERDQGTRDAGGEGDAGVDMAPPDLGPPGGGAATSAQIQAIRDATPGAIEPALPVTDAIVTYVRGQFGADPEGFFVQAEAAGPALFVAVDPDGLPFRPDVGDIVSFDATETEVTALERQHRVIAISNYLETESGIDVGFLIQDASAVDLTTELDDYESEMVTVVATIVDDPTVEDEPEPCGNPHVCFRITTDGVVDGTDQLRLRGFSEVVDEADLAVGCSITLGPTPLWRNAGNAQVLILDRAEVDISDCNLPQVIGAVGVSPGSVRIDFDRFIDFTSVVDAGSQFNVVDMMGNERTASGVPIVNERSITIDTQTMVPGRGYTVRVADMSAAFPIQDTLGNGVDPTAASADFSGYDDYIEINEVEFDEEGYQFIEIYNQSDGNVSLMGMDLFAVDMEERMEAYGRADLETNSEGATFLMPGEYLVVLTDDSADVDLELPFGTPTVTLEEDGVATSLLTSDAGLLLRGGGGEIRCQDAVWWEGNRFFGFSMCGFEGRLPPDDGTTDASLQRTPNGADSNANDADFQLRVRTPGESNGAG
ncbi:MAG: hypothetical protein ACFCGT_21515 [Sandaracinaceae bacterium]